MCQVYKNIFFFDFFLQNLTGLNQAEILQWVQYIYIYIYIYIVMLVSFPAHCRTSRNSLGMYILCERIIHSQLLKVGLDRTVLHSGNGGGRWAGKLIPENNTLKKNVPLLLLVSLQLRSTSNNTDGNKLVIYFIQYTVVALGNFLMSETYNHWTH